MFLFLKKLHHTNIIHEELCAKGTLPSVSLTNFEFIVIMLESTMITITNVASVLNNSCS